MANTFDFGKIKKKYFNITLTDGTKLQVRTPVKRVYEKMRKIDTSPESDQAEQADALFELCAEILSNNVEGKILTTDYVAENFDYEDVSLFIVAYYEYVQEAITSPN